jgi:hypothetical protein
MVLHIADRFAFFVIPKLKSQHLFSSIFAKCKKDFRKNAKTYVFLRFNL